MKSFMLVAMSLSLALGGRFAFGQCQRQELVPSDGQAGDNFGLVVTMSGDWAAISAPEEDSVAVNSGAVYLFQRVGATWIEMQKLKSPNPVLGGGFGWSIAMSGTVLVVGEPYPSAGQAYVYEFSNGAWSEIAELISGDPDYQDEFGARVATTGDRILVAAVGDDERAPDAGAVYVFDRSNPSWTQTAKLMATDGAPYDEFGGALDVRAKRALIAAPGKSGPAGLNVGAVYVFDDELNGWTQTQKLLANDSDAYDYVGWSVAILDVGAAVGAPGHTHAGGTLGGAVYVFNESQSAWTLTQELSADDELLVDSLGYRLSADADHLVVASNAMSTGSAYDFRYAGSTWIQAGKLLARDGRNGDDFGPSVISGTTVLVGAHGADPACPNDTGCDSGAAYVFELGTSATQYGHCPSNAPCNNVDLHGGCRNSTGQGAILAACGSGSVTTDDLQIEVTHCPANKLTLLFMGGGQVRVPFGDGIRVVGGGGIGTFRFGGLSADVQGIAMRGPGLVAQSQGFHNSSGHIQAGQSWNFQVWYRDTVGPCGGLTNYSNGVQVAFTP